jgi:hypothetical protein
MECCANADEDNRRNTESANNIYDLPSIPAAICFLHAAAGYPTKATWLRVIKTGTMPPGQPSLPHQSQRISPSPSKRSRDIPKNRDKT